MKYIVLLCDGMADLPLEKLSGKTPMEAAQKPNMDRLASLGEVGTVATVPEGMSPGSDVANLSVMGYDVKSSYTGRSPLEAANLGITLSESDISFRVNLVTLSDDENYEDKRIIDYCAGDIHTKEADALIMAIKQEFADKYESFNFYTGTSYRHCMVWHEGPSDIRTLSDGKLTPPHDITGKVIGEYLPKREKAPQIYAMMKESYQLLKNHPINIQRVKDGKAPANAIWVWGEGKKPILENFTAKFGKVGAVISAVDLLKGIGRLTGQTPYDVEGATGYIDTYYEGKVEAALHALFNGHDFVYLHIEAPDECGHRGEVANKVKAIEDIDKRALKPLLKALDANLAENDEDYKIMILPDHPTPLSLLTHTSDPVPYLIYDSRSVECGEPICFCEKSAEMVGNHVAVGHTLINKLFS